jgi:hypothetical protein
MRHPTLFNSQRYYEDDLSVNGQKSFVEFAKNFNSKKSSHLRHRFENFDDCRTYTILNETIFFCSNRWFSIPVRDAYVARATSVSAFYSSEKMFATLKKMLSTSFFCEKQRILFELGSEDFVRK